MLKPPVSRSSRIVWSVVIIVGIVLIIALIGYLSGAWETPPDA